MFGRHSTQEKFLKNVIDGSFTNPKTRAFKNESHPISITLGIIKIGDPACCKAPGDVGVVRLPTSVVAFAEDRKSVV